ncbi:MAG TPA: riboflavin biosynthesis protein RibF [Myxococcales bacterium]|nr:riboflavin biosynthesis protein RibF [Myxococcales bacterium]
MRIHSSLDDSVDQLIHGSIAIGNFDGVHLGHQALFKAERNQPRAALVFEPHPARVLAPQYAPRLICEPWRRRELIASCGVTDLIEHPFTKEFAALEPRRFVEMLLATGVAEVVVGYDFTYGKARIGTVESLRVALEERGVHLVVVPRVTVNGLVCSSTKVREFVLEGRVEAASMLLGRPFDLQGEVIHGDGRGRKLGWPTANIRSTNDLVPAAGVYAVRARLMPDGAQLAGAANLGLNPTFRTDAALAGRPPLSLEVFLFDFDHDIYGRTVRVEFIHRLREERRFPGIDALKQQIARDVRDARRLLGVTP